MAHTQTAIGDGDKPLRPAASLLAIRDGAQGLEVLVMKRSDAMRFLPGFLSFPGGSLSPGDFQLQAAWWQGSLQEQQLADDPAYAIGALRETAEEAGLLLGVCDAARRPQSPTLPPALQDDLLAERVAYVSVLKQHSLRVDGSNLRFVGRWITPPFMPARFDTRFFVTKVATPAEALRVNPAENQWVRWQSPTELLEAIRAKAQKAAPPTIAMLEGLARYDVAQTCFEELQVPGPDPNDPALRSVLNDL